MATRKRPPEPNPERCRTALVTPLASRDGRSLSPDKGRAERRPRKKLARLSNNTSSASRAPEARPTMPCCDLLREPDRGADTCLEDGIGLGAVRGRAGDLEGPCEEPQEGRRVRAAHLLALPR
jgi:hypothetical protein